MLVPLSSRLSFSLHQKLAMKEEIRLGGQALEWCKKKAIVQPFHEIPHAVISDLALDARKITITV